MKKTIFSTPFTIILFANIAFSFDCVLIDDVRIESIKQRIEQKVEPAYSAYRQLEKNIQADIRRQPHVPDLWYVPGFYLDADGHTLAKEVLQDDANAAYRLALMYRLSGRTDCAETAIRLIDAWAANLKTLSDKDDSTLSFSYHFPSMIFAADLLKDSPLWSKDRQDAFKQFVREKALPMNTMDRQNNWGNWGLVLVMASAAYLDSEDLFQKGVARWKEFIEQQIAEDGHLPHEVDRNGGRSGIWYSNFCLLPQTIAAEIVRANGTSVYDYVAPNGRSLRQAFERLAPWTNHPETFPYWKKDPKRLSGVTYVSYYEILNALWPNPDATEMLNRLRPLTARHSLPLLTLTHGQPGVTQFEGKPYTDGDTFADTWVATDALGREAPGIEQCGPVKKDKWVGIFYWTWHTPGRGGPFDNTKILSSAKNGEVTWPEKLEAHHWGEPELGYYVMTDPFVIRKHASMLVDAGIDVILFDTTNPPFTWKEEYEALCREYTAMRQEGARTPSIGFIAPFGDPTAITDRLWKDLYQPGLWKELWFMWDGKPFLLANKEYIKDKEMLDFFTFRRPMPDYWIGPSGPDQWSWLEVYPQHVFKNSKGEAEQMSVGVAQNALPNTPGPAPMSHKTGAMGRSWHDGKKDEHEGAVDLGLNFTEQWKRIYEVDPTFVFVTGWNEWIAGRFLKWSHYTDQDCYYPGGMFVDEYDQEYSRDCEPMRGGHSDNYYYQLADCVRRFKGVRERPKATGPSRITIDGSFGDWQNVSPEFRDTIADTTHRNHPGYGDIVYRNDTGRNDFVIAKAAYDADYFYFFVQTSNKITPTTDKNWMLLFLDVDQSTKTGWLGYDYIVNLEVASDTETTLKAWNDGSWKQAGHAIYRVNGNGLELKMHRSLIDQMKTSPKFDFHWADNIQSFDDVSELGVNGDSAPNRRWNYRFDVTK